MRNFDYPMPYQGKMAKSALHHAARDATQLRNLLQDGDAIPQWVHYKIATAAHDLAKVNRYMQYQVKQHPSGYARKNPETDPAFVARAIKIVTPKLKKAKKSKKPVVKKAAFLLFNTLQMNPKDAEILLTESLKGLYGQAAQDAPPQQIQMLRRVTALALKTWQSALRKAA